MGDRLAAGIVTAVALCITLVAGALFVSIYRGGPTAQESLAIWSALPRLLAWIAAIGFVAGVILGSARAVAMLSHLWGTARPRQPVVTLGLWLLILGLWIVVHIVS